MSGDEVWSALVPALLNIEGIPNMGELDNVEAPYIADALLPVVDRLANQRAAAMLRQAADWIWDDVPALASASAELHARADHLDPS